MLYLLVIISSVCAIRTSYVPSPSSQPTILTKTKPVIDNNISKINIIKTSKLSVKNTDDLNLYDTFDKKKNENEDKKNSNLTFFLIIVIGILGVLLYSFYKKLIKMNKALYNKLKEREVGELPFHTPPSSPLSSDRNKEKNFGFITPSPGMYKRSVNFSSFNDQNI